MKYLGKGIATLGIWLGAVLMMAICAIPLFVPLMFFGEGIILGAVGATAVVWAKEK